MKYISTVLACIRTIALGILAVWMGLLFKSRLVMPYNEMGNYFDVATGTNYSEQAKEVYGLITLLLTIFFAISSYHLIARLRCNGHT